MLLTVITGDVDTVDFLTGIPILILGLSYSRAFEKEADDFALEQLHRFDILVDYFATILQCLENYYVDQEKGAVVFEGEKTIEEVPADESKSIGGF